MGLISNTISNYHQIKSLYSYPTNKIPFVLLILLTVFLLSSCGSSGSSDSDVSSTAINGYVIDGPISNSSVTLHRINSDGSTGEQVAGPFTTDANGQWTGTIPNTITGLLVVVAQGGQYTDDATNDTVTLAPDEKIHSWFDTDSDEDQGVVSPLTDSLWQLARQEMSDGETVSNAVANTEQVAVNFWGLDPTNVVPDDSSSNTAEQRYGVLLAGFSFLINNHALLQVEPFSSMNRFTLMRLLMNDMADGRLDGFDIDGTPIFAADGTFLPALSVNDLSAFFSEANDYAETLQIDPVENDPNQSMGFSRPIVCPAGGIIIYSHSSDNIYHATVDHENLRIFSSQDRNSQTNETIFIDNYFIPFQENNNELVFTVTATRSAGSALVGWTMNSYGDSSTYEPEKAYKIGVSGRVIFERDTPFKLRLPSGQTEDYFICGNFTAGAGTTGFPPAGETHDDQYIVGGIVTGLNGTVELQNNSTDDEVISTNGRFSFSTLYDDQDFYNVSILTQPIGQTCSLSNSAGQINGGHTLYVGVSCIDNPEQTYTIGGNVSGLGNGDAVVMQNNAGDNLATSNNGAFTFSTPLLPGAPYNVSIFSISLGQSCSVTQGSGTVATSNVTDVEVVCSDLPSYLLGGSVTGLNGNLELTNSNGDVVQLTANGSYNFSGVVYQGEDYEISITASPVSQNCSMTNSTGTVASSNIVNANVSCTDIANPTYSIGGSVTGLNGSLVLQNNGGDNLPITADGSFTFGTELLSSAEYAITVLSSPITQNCSLSSATGTISSADISNVVVTCADIPTYSIGGSVTGLNGSLVLQNNGGDNLPITADGSFTFGTELLSGAGYAVTVLSSPVTQNCSVSSSANGTVATADIISVAVSCSNLPDNTAPVITLSGATPLNIEINSVYIDAGATATDNFDGIITADIVTINPVDTATLGTYLITYNVSDAAGNAAAQVTRTVNVVAVVTTVEAYYSAAPNWNDYVKNDNSTQFDATNTEADGTETGGYFAVIHGGEMRSVDSGEVSCTDQAATDTLGVFDWVCDDSTGSALLVSTGLKNGKHLSDLLNFTTPGWLSNSVTVTGTGAALPFATTATQWWSNPVANAGTGLDLDTSGNIYIVTEDLGYNFALRDSQIGLVIQPGVTFTPVAEGFRTEGIGIGNGNSRFSWFEGTVDCGTLSGGTITGVRMGGTFNVLRNVTAVNCSQTGVSLRTDNSRLSYVTVSNGNGIGVGIHFVNSDNNSLSNIVSTHNRSYGIQIASSSGNRLSNVTVSNNESYLGLPAGIFIYSSSSRNSLSNITVTNTGRSNGGPGIYIVEPDNILLNVTAFNNKNSGINLYGSNNVVSNITAVENGGAGIFLGISSNNSLSNLAMVNNNADGIGASSGSNNYFTGLLKVGNNGQDCRSVIGLDDTTCVNNGNSDTLLTTGVTLSTSFVGEVMTDDTANQSDSNGTAAFPTNWNTFDWASFENPYRGWISTSFENTSINGQWYTGDGFIWDWSLSTSDTGTIRNAITVIPDGDDTITHTWSDDTTTTYLRDAVEIANDFIGNDNGLCESNETCLFTPNIGAYQGHGELISAGTFIDGSALTGINLLQYETNGY